MIEVMGEAYPHLVERRDEILAAIEREEAQFARTLDAGTRLLEAALAGLAAGRAGRSGGAPEDLPAGRAASSPATSRSASTTRSASRIDLTVELAAEYGVAVDRAGFDAALAEQRDRSRQRQEGRADAARRAGGAVRGDPGPGRRHEFLGYETTTADGTRRRDRPRRAWSSTS